MNLENYIPVSDRKTILEGDYISKAIPGSMEMDFLMQVWKKNIEPDLQVTCNLCYDRVLKNWKSILPALIVLEKNYRILNELT